MAASLDNLGVPFLFEPDKLPYTYNYVPDFKVGKVYLEAKGYLDDDEVRKLRAVKAAHPSLDIRLVFQRASNRIGKMTYGQWAEKNGYLWCEGPDIPEEWVEEFKYKGVQWSYRQHD